MRKSTILKSLLLLCALVAGSSSVWAQTVLFHETFGNNSGSARNWQDSYSVKSGVAKVYGEVDAYTVTGAKQSKNNVGATDSGLLQTTANTEASIIIGPLNVVGYENLTLSYKWNAASTKKTYSTSVAYATSSTSDYTTIKTYGNTTGATSLGATSFIDCDYTLPAAASVSTLYLKISFNTSNTQALIDEVDLSYTGPAIVAPLEDAEASTISIATCTYNSTTKYWINNDNVDYTFGNGSTAIATKSYTNGTSGTRIKLSYGETYNLSVPSTVAISKIEIKGQSNNLTDGSDITIGGITRNIKALATKTFYLSSHTAGTAISIGVAGKEFGLESIVLYTADSKIITTTANMDGWRSFYDATQDYEIDANTTIYVAAKSSEENSVTLTPLDVTKIPHGEAVILKTSAADHKMTLTKTTGAASLGDNVLTVTDGTSNVDGYRLGYKDGTGVAFFKYTATKPSAGIVYIAKANVNTGSTAPEFLTIGGETTGISQIENGKFSDGAECGVAKTIDNSEVYNLNGQRVAQPTKGLYIVNGKKVIIK